MIEFYAKMLAFLTAEREDEKGATAVEYGLLVALIAAALIAVIGFLGDGIERTFQDVVDALPGA
ncbi:Flp family type IVb pilin [Nocardioides sp. Bht2]|uniref:Flp family type IVb pilin n=1 Tax=Nocardioides sp. Bht2 TaxID=3392297 RepID=UPI0039B6BD0C